MEIFHSRLRKKRKQSGKPDSVLLAESTIYLMRSYPGLKRSGPLLVPYLILLRTGFTLPPLSPAERWALTPPFHPYPSRKAGNSKSELRNPKLSNLVLPAQSAGGRFIFCGTFHHRRYGTGVPALTTGRPALRSPDFPPSRRSKRAADTLCLRFGNVRGLIATKNTKKHKRFLQEIFDRIN